MTKKDFGIFKQKGKDKWTKQNVFFKPHPMFIANDHVVSDFGKASYDQYQAVFFNVGKLLIVLF